MYPEASILGISYDEYWEMQPILVIKVAKAKEREFITKANFQLALAWQTASLIGLAVNEPKKFPKEPPRVDSEEEKIKRARKLAAYLNALSMKEFNVGSGGQVT